MDRRANRRMPNHSNWRMPPIDGTGALKFDAMTVSNVGPQLRLAPQISADQPPVMLRDRYARARDQYVTQEQGKNKTVIAYEVEQDGVLYKVLAGERGMSSYESAKRDLDVYIDIQLQTHLGERLNVGISSIRHNIVNGELRIAGTEESLLETIKRGQQYRRTHGKEVDWDRELAEVVGFERIQKKLADPKTKIGTKMMSVSLTGDVENGSIYKKNFYDVHEKISETEVVSTRYTSGLTPEDSNRRLRLIDSRYNREIIPTDAEMLANPVEVAPGVEGLETADAIHDFMHVNHPHMSRQKFAVVMQACKPLRDDYKDSLTIHPNNTFEHKRRLDILMNYADNVATELESIPEGRVLALNDREEAKSLPWIPPQIDKAALARQEVRVTETGCGSSGSTSSSQFSVAESAPNREGNTCPTCSKSSLDNHYHCPSCTYRYSDETNTARTKKCDCGFEFSC